MKCSHQTRPSRGTVRAVPAFPDVAGVKHMMQYKGYVAAVEFDHAVGRLHGRVVNSGAYPIATFAGTDVDGIRREFHRSIDEYLALCREDGVEPKKPRAPSTCGSAPTCTQRAALSATAHGVSLNSWVKQAVEENASR